MSRLDAGPNQAVSASLPPARGALPRLAWCRFRATFRRRWGGYLALAVLIGLVGGVAMGSVVAARRTDSSYPRFLASTNPSDLVVQPFTAPSYSPGFVRQLARLPHVAGAAVAVPLTAATLTPGGRPGTVLLANVQLAATVGGPDGLYSGQDRVTITAGRRADPARADEAVATQGAAARYDTAVGAEYNHLLATSSYISPGGSELYVYVTSAIEAEAQRSIRPEAIALGVFGLIAGLAALIIGTQSISRQLRAGADDAGALRALGAGPAMMIADGLPGIAAAVTAGALLAVGVAIALSPFSLFGPVREVEPGRGIYLDAAVLGLGAIGLVLALGGVATVIAYRQLPHRLAGRTPAAIVLRVE